MSQNNFDKLTALGIPLKFGTKGQCKVLCPKCSHTRKPEHQKEPCLSVNVEEGKWSCHNPGCGFFGNVDFVDRKPAKIYVKPQWVNVTNLSNEFVLYAASRGLSQQTLISAHINEGAEWMPQTQKPEWTVQFPYFRDGEVVNVKYRDAAKNFKLVKDAEKIFYNIDSTKDTQECLICEGEFDALSFVGAGYLPAISVPNGATLKTNNLQYLDNCIDYFENKTKIYIGVDNDEAGRALRDELVRRLGAERCWIINYGDCKDGNEYLIKYGQFALMGLFATAKGAVIEGIVEINDMSDAIDDIYENGLQRGWLTGIKDIDEILSFPDSAFAVLTGIANHGKSPFADYLIARLVVKFNLKCAYFSPENEPNALHAVGLISLLTGKSFDKDKKYGYDKHLNRDELKVAKAFMQDHYYFISEETNEGYANQFTLANFSVDNIFDYAKKMVLKYGINILVIDPWNTLDHQYGVGHDKLDYISKALDKFRNFAKKYNVFTLLIAHPTKMQKELVKVKDEETGAIKEKWKFRVPDLSNVADSNHFHNKPAIGLTFYRDYDRKVSTLIVNKMKHKHIGHHGSVDVVYDWISGRFTVDGLKHDTTNWLVSGVPLMGYNEPSSVIGIPVEPVIVAGGNENNDIPF